MNNKRSPHTSQVKKALKQRVLSDPHKEFERVNNILSSLDESRLRTLGFLLNRSAYFSKVNYALETIGDWIGLKESQTRRHLQDLERYRLIQILHRPNKTNIYVVSWIFESDEYGHALSYWFKKYEWAEKAVFNRIVHDTLVNNELSNNYKLNAVGGIPPYVSSLVLEDIVLEDKIHPWHPTEKECSSCDAFGYAFEPLPSITSSPRPSGGGSLDSPPSRAGSRVEINFNQKKGVVMISSYNKRLAEQYGITRYSQVLLSAFPDSVLVDAVADMKTQDVQNPVTWLFKRCQELCKSQKIEPYYDEMLREVEACGYKSGDKLMIERDPEAQFRYDDPPISPLSRKNHSSMKPRTEKPIVQVISDNYFAKKFTVPQWALENDKIKMKGA